jgi:hypothetical protein
MIHSPLSCDLFTDPSLAIVARFVDKTSCPASNAAPPKTRTPIPYPRGPTFTSERKLATSVEIGARRVCLSSPSRRATMTTNEDINQREEKPSRPAAGARPAKDRRSTMREKPVTARPATRTPTDAVLRRTSLRHRRIARKPELRRKLRNMAIELSPLVQVTTGLVHPAFPRKMLQFWLLTDEQLEDMARFYHQRSPPGSGGLRTQYPCPITWSSDLPLEEKRRKIGKFIGLRGCETPVWLLTEEEIAAEARKARIAEEEEMWKRKLHPGRF